MQARAFAIDEKVKIPLFRVTRPSDFKMHDDAAIDARAVLQDPSISLYCLDFENRQALFVQTPPECDLTLAPFFYAAQYEAALRVIQIPFAMLHQLADDVEIDPSKLILIYSVGRCGSTLVSCALREVEGVESLSEPDVFTQMLGEWRADNLEGEEKARLVKSCTLLLCAPGRVRGATAWALKFRSMVTHMGLLLHSVFPEASLIFLYRDIESWMRSMLRMRGGDPHEPIPLAPMRAQFGHTDPRLKSREVASVLEINTWRWLSIMEVCLEMQRRGIPLFVARYEELTRAPHEVLTRMFAHCGLAGRAVGDLHAVLARDSQAGTDLSRESLGAKPAQLTPEIVEELHRLLRESSQELTAESILPDTYIPSGSF